MRLCNITCIICLQCNNTEFSCNIGTCIPLFQQCNGMTNCEDASDEANCKLVVISQDYKMEDGPIDADANGTDVFVNFIIFDLNSFHEISMSYRVKFALTLKWNDSRLTFTNLQNGTDFKNKIGKEERERIWIPQLLISNSLDLKFTELGGISSLTVEQLGPYKFNSISEPAERRLYKGSENILIYRNTYEIELHCDFNLYNYPFDHQFCKIVVKFKLCFCFTV